MIPSCRLRRLFVASLNMATYLAFALDGQAQQFNARVESYPTQGNPTTAVATRDGQYVFVSETNVNGPNDPGPDSAAGTRTNVTSGIEVFRRRGQLMHRSKLRSIAFVRTGGFGANGLVLLRGEKTLVAGVGDDGVAFLDVDDLVHGRGKPFIVSQGERAGTFDVVATPDGKYVFSSNEYGVIHGQRGNIGIVATNIDASGHVTKPEELGRIAAGDVVPSLSLSPDGSRLYVASELVPSSLSSLAGADNPALTKHDCVQKKGTKPRVNGLITVLDVSSAISGQGDPVLARVAAGCSPVRLVESRDASALYVSARGDDVILTFNPGVLESDPEHAFERAFPSGGTAPVGVSLFANDRLLAVADSNRFADANGNLALIPVTGASTAPLQSIPTGQFPRNISANIDGKTLYLTNYTSRSLQVLRVTQ